MKRGVFAIQQNFGVQNQEREAKFRRQPVRLITEFGRAGLQPIRPSLVLLRRDSEDLADAPEVPGSVKWYDPVKGFGFVAVDGESKDLFVHRSVVGRAGLGELAPGQNVMVRIVEGRKGREVGAIRES